MYLWYTINMQTTPNHSTPQQFVPGAGWLVDVVNKYSPENTREYEACEHPITLMFPAIAQGCVLTDA